MAFSKSDNKLRTAQQLGFNQDNSQNLRVTDRLGKADPRDIYSFRLDKSSNLTLNLLNKSGKAKVELLDGQGKQIVSSRSTGKNENIALSLSEGSYYLRVRQLRGNPKYTFNLFRDSLEKISIEQEPINIFNGRFYQAVRGTDNLIYTRFSSDGSTWNPWKQTEGTTLSTPAMTQFKGQLYQVIQGTDNAIYLRITGDGENWSSWTTLNIGGQTLGAPELTVFQNKLVLAVRGTDNKIYVSQSENGATWNPWQDAGGTTLSGPGITVFNNRLLMSVRGTINNEVYFSSSADGINWNPWGLADGQTLSSPELGVFNGQVYMVVRGTDDNVYIKRSVDGQNWGLPWAVLDGKAKTGLELDVFNDQVFLTVGGTDKAIYLNRSGDGTTWAGWNQYGGETPFESEETPVPSPSISYRPELSSKTPSSWDRDSGESAQYGKYGNFPGGDLVQEDMPSNVLAVYEDLSISIFGIAKGVNSGYAFDNGYLSLGVGYHAGIDINAANGTVVRAATNGIVARVYTAIYGGVVGVDETNNLGEKTGRRWWYVHMSSNSVQVGNTVTAGQTELGKVGMGHLHLAITSSSNTSDPANGVSAADVTIRTMSPLDAFWRAKNNINGY